MNGGQQTSGGLVSGGIGSALLGSFGSAFSGAMSVSQSNAAIDRNIGRLRTAQDQARTRGEYGLNLSKLRMKQEKSSLNQDISNAGVSSTSGSGARLLNYQEGHNQRALQWERYNEIDIPVYNLELQIADQESRKGSVAGAIFSGLGSGIGALFGQLGAAATPGGSIGGSCGTSYCGTAGAPGATSDFGLPVGQEYPAANFGAYDTPRQSNWDYNMGGWVTGGQITRLDNYAMFGRSYGSPLG